MKMARSRGDPGGGAIGRVRANRIGWLVVAPALLLSAFAAGRWSAAGGAAAAPLASAPLASAPLASAPLASAPWLGAARAALAAGVPLAASDPRLVQAAEPRPDARELIPLPGPGQGPGSGQIPGQEPGQQPAPGECLLVMPDGQLFRLEVPGPGDGPAPGNGGTPELFPLVPAPGPPAPATPRPQGPPPGTLQM